MRLSARTVVFCVFFGTVVAGCGGNGTHQTGSGGNGGGTTGSGGGGTTTSVTTSSSSSSSSSGSSGSGGMACAYPEITTPTTMDEYAYFVSSPNGPILPLPDEVMKGASASRRGPWATDRTLIEIKLVTSTSGITSVKLAVWTQVGLDPGTHAPVYQTLPVASVTPDATRYIYRIAIPELVVPKGQSVFAATPLNNYIPFAYFPGSCYDESVTWWYGRPISTDGTPTWATLLTPKDNSVESYEYDLATIFGFKP